MRGTTCPEHGPQTITHMGPETVTAACGHILLNGNIVYPLCQSCGYRHKPLV